MKSRNYSIYIIAMILAVIDQFIKYITMKNLNLYQSINVIDNFFSITYVENDGAAWSILSGNKLILIFLTLVALILINKFYIINQKLNVNEKIIYGTLIGGIFGNLIDRIFRGVVIDYLDFKIFNYNFPVFNMADICIVVSVILLAILILRGEKNANNNK